MSTEPKRIALSGERQLLVCECREDKQYPTPTANEILIIDDRAAKDPSFQIRESYRISKKAHREEILNALIDYAKAHPMHGSDSGQWQRTAPSMEKEWLLHNMAYQLHILQSSSKHVDLNNGEERGSLRYYVVRIAAIIWRRVKRPAKR